MPTSSRNNHTIPYFNFSQPQPAAEKQEPKVNVQLRNLLNRSRGPSKDRNKSTVTTTATHSVRRSEDAPSLAAGRSRSPTQIQPFTNALNRKVPRYNDSGIPQQSANFIPPSIPAASLSAPALHVDQSSDSPLLSHENNNNTTKDAQLSNFIEALISPPKTKKAMFSVGGKAFRRSSAAGGLKSQDSSHCSSPTNSSYEAHPSTPSTPNRSRAPSTTSVSHTTPPSSHGRASTPSSVVSPKGHRHAISYPISPGREAIRSASAFLCKELGRPGKIPDKVIEKEVEIRLRALVRMEKRWVGLGTNSSPGEEKERLCWHDAVRDGYVICHLVNRISQNWKQLKPSLTQAASSANIDLFLSACVEFGLNPRDLFFPSDLLCTAPSVDGAVRVANTVLALSISVPLSSTSRTSSYQSFSTPQTSFPSPKSTPTLGTTRAFKSSSASLQSNLGLGSPPDRRATPPTPPHITASPPDSIFSSSIPRRPYKTTPPSPLGSRAIQIPSSPTESRSISLSSNSGDLLSDKLPSLSTSSPRQSTESSFSLPELATLPTPVAVRIAGIEEERSVYFTMTGIISDIPEEGNSPLAPTSASPGPGVGTKLGKVERVQKQILPPITTVERPTPLRRASPSKYPDNSTLLVRRPSQLRGKSMEVQGSKGSSVPSLPLLEEGVFSGSPGLFVGESGSKLMKRRHSSQTTEKPLSPEIVNLSSTIANSSTAVSTTHVPFPVGSNPSPGTRTSNLSQSPTNVTSKPQRVRTTRFASSVDITAKETRPDLPQRSDSISNDGRYPNMGSSAASLVIAREVSTISLAKYGSATRTTLVVKEDGKPPVSYQLGNCIGRGQFGSVYRALNLTTGQMMAIKRIALDGMSENDVNQLMKEVELLKRLTHPSIVKYEGMVRDSDTLNIVLEYVENGSLGQTVKSFGNLNEKLVASYVLKILEGLHYLHSQHVVHCDLKAANLLTTKNGNVKLSDFGVSLNLLSLENMKNDVTGTPNWMAPEVIELKGASTASDIWSLGCTIIELLTGKPPYGNIRNGMSVMFRIVEDDSPPIPDSISPQLKKFLMLCFDKDPSMRPSAEVLFEHEWLEMHWGLNKLLRPQDSIPFLRRVSNEISMLELSKAYENFTKHPNSSAISFAGSIEEIGGPGRRSLDGGRRSIDAPYVSQAILVRSASTTGAGKRTVESQLPIKSHGFVKFNKGVHCHVCLEPIKKTSILCVECGLIVHHDCQQDASAVCEILGRLYSVETAHTRQTQPEDSSHLFGTSLPDDFALSTSPTQLTGGLSLWMRARNPPMSPPPATLGRRSEEDFGSEANRRRRHLNNRRSLSVVRRQASVRSESTLSFKENGGAFNSGSGGQSSGIHIRFSESRKPVPDVFEVAESTESTVNVASPTLQTFLDKVRSRKSSLNNKSSVSNYTNTSNAHLS